MVIWNEVTYCLLLGGRYQAGANRMQQEGKIELEANALGNTKGYADELTVIWNVRS